MAMEAASTKRSYIRLGAMRLLLEGMGRELVCKIYNRSDRMVRLWIEMFNRGGIDALASKPRSGRSRKVKLERVRDLVVPVLEEPSQAGELHWTEVKLLGFLQERLQIALSYRTIINYLHEQDYNLRVPRPWPERQNEEQRSAFLEQLRNWQADPTIELWFADECGVEGDTTSAAALERSGQPAKTALSRRPYPCQCHRRGVSGYRRMLHDDF